MLKFLYPQINWEKVSIVGFDLDGTLYDEIEFISQVYRPIAQTISKSCQADFAFVYYWMLSRWLEKGSSYNRIFDEILIKHNVNKDDRDLVVSECLHIFRNFVPALNLPKTVSFILTDIKTKYAIFLLTDGSKTLQTEKFKALQLDKWFDSQDVAIAGNYGRDYLKPSTKVLTKIKVLQNCLNPETVVYFGDREVDREFANTAGFTFVKVKSMIPIENNS